MKVVTGREMADLDKAAIEGIGIPSLLLMENAGRGVADSIKERYPNCKKAVVIVGRGNNGGDGLVVARYLINSGVEVKTFIIGEKEKLSPPTKTNASILEGMKAPIKYIQDVKEVAAEMEKTDLVIDALLGIGIKGEVRGLYRKVIELINASQNIVAVDIPSGLEASSGQIAGVCVKANLTVTMELPKLGLLLYPGREYVGELVVKKIGYPTRLVEEFETNLELVEDALVKKKMPPRKPYSHKGTYGRVFVLAGSVGMTGAAALTAESALRAGAGLVTLGIPQSLNPILEEKLTEVITRPLPEIDGALSPEALSQIEDILKEQDVLAVGPGISQRPQTAQLIRELLPKMKLPLVIDADGVNNLTVDILNELNAPTILTPHPGELSRLIKKPIAQIERDRVGTAKEFACNYNVVLVLKGVPTVTSLPSGEVYINPTGNSGLASGGSGDVLTGIIAGLLAQGAKPGEAGFMGAYIHGLIADLLKEELGERAMIAGDLVRKMPEALKRFG
jgi:NAD(P)H-hydrate epimerase